MLGSVGCARVTSQPGLTPRQSWTVPGVLRWGEYTEPDTLNPMLSSLQVTLEESMLWAAYLFHYNDENEFVPELATKMPTIENGGISPDGLTITYHLRPAVRWQDGAPFGADDVIFSWHAIMNPRNNIPSREGYDLIRDIRKVDDHTIIIHLSRPYAPFTSMFFTMGALAYPILPKHVLSGLSDINRASYNSMPIGTGPFRVVDYRHGQYLKLTANPIYWRGAPGLKEVYVTFVGDQNTLLTQLQTHEIDFVTNVALTHVPEFKGIDGVALRSTPFTYFTYIGFNVESPPLRDVRVRRALAMATNRTLIIQNVTHGYALDADSDQPPFLWAHAPGTKQPRFDPSSAAKLLDAAGWRVGSDGYRYKNGAKLDLVIASTVGNAGYIEAEQVLQEGWRDIGVSSIIKNAQDSVLYAPAAEHGVFASGAFDVMINGWFNGVDPDDSDFFMCSQRPPNGDNYRRLCDPRLDAAERLALSSNDRATRRAAYADIQRFAADDCAVIFLWFAKRVDAVSTELKGYRPAHAVTPLWNTYAWRI